MLPDDIIDNLYNNFKDVGIDQETFDLLVQRAITSRVSIDNSLWLRDKSIDFYFGMLACWRLYSALHKKVGFNLKNLQTSRYVDDELGEEISIVITSIFK